MWIDNKNMLISFIFHGDNSGYSNNVMKQHIGIKKNCIFSLSCDIYNTKMLLFQILVIEKILKKKTILKI